MVSLLHAILLHENRKVCAISVGLCTGMQLIRDHKANLAAAESEREAAAVAPADERGGTSASGSGEQEEAAALDSDAEEAAAGTPVSGGKRWASGGDSEGEAASSGSEGDRPHKKTKKAALKAVIAKQRSTAKKQTDLTPGTSEAERDLCCVLTCRKDQFMHLVRASCMNE